MNEIDKKVKEYISRASKFVQKEYAEKMPHEQLVKDTVLIAHMIQAEEHYQGKNNSKIFLGDNVKAIIFTRTKNGAVKGEIITGTVEWISDEGGLFGVIDDEFKLKHLIDKTNIKKL